MESTWVNTKDKLIITFNVKNSFLFTCAKYLIVVVTYFINCKMSAMNVMFIGYKLA